MTPCGLFGACHRRRGVCVCMFNELNLSFTILQLFLCMVIPGRRERRKPAETLTLLAYCDGGSRKLLCYRLYPIRLGDGGRHGHEVMVVVSEHLFDSDKRILMRAWQATARPASNGVRYPSLRYELSESLGQSQARTHCMGVAS